MAWSSDYPPCSHFPPVCFPLFCRSSIRGRDPAHRQAEKKVVAKKIDHAVGENQRNNRTKASSRTQKKIAAKKLEHEAEIKNEIGDLDSDSNPEPNRAANKTEDPQADESKVENQDPKSRIRISSPFKKWDDPPSKATRQVAAEKANNPKVTGNDSQPDSKSSVEKILGINEKNKDRVAIANGQPDAKKIRIIALPFRKRNTSFPIRTALSSNKRQPILKRHWFGFSRRKKRASETIYCYSVDVLREEYAERHGG